MVPLLGTPVDIFQQIAEELGRGRADRLAHLVHGGHALGDALGPLVRVLDPVHLQGLPVVLDTHGPAAADLGDGRTKDRCNEHAVAVHAVQRRQWRYARGHALFIGQRIEPVPKALDQPAGQAEAVTQTREAVLAGKGLDQPTGDLQVLRLLG